MAFTTSTSILKASGGTSPRITNVAVSTANTEVAHTLVASLKQILIRSRDGHKIQLAFTSTESGTKFITIKPGAVFQQSGVEYAGGSLYIQTDQGPGVVEILEWS